MTDDGHWSNSSSKQTSERERDQQKSSDADEDEEDDKRGEEGKPTINQMRLWRSGIT